MTHSGVVTLGGKGSSLSSSPVFAVAASQSLVHIDSSTLDKLKTSPSSSTTTTITLPKFLTVTETRASQLILLNNLSSILTPLPFNSSPKPSITLTWTLLNRSTFRPAVFAANFFFRFATSLSCEALKADVTAFNLMDSGDGHSSKEEVGVAADLRVLLNGSKLAHSKTRVELNSSGSDGTEEAVSTVLLPLAAALRELGLCSFSRAKSNLEFVGSDDLKLRIREMFEKDCPNCDSLGSGFNKALTLVFGKDYDIVCA
ncbi:hypothetical protein TanjilG_29221 [Lupinus angustifolius]|uniref:Uncharacterized protein n=1 Tax=Lupinus angustifolius TaxID=3871 RepID=A0A1J7GID7_LUPAN|nr:hypothetical protein TanjilG_29221 [Lupinus angustifolius]